jgi:predicted RNA-binding protein with RPS1 domain
MGNPKRMVQRTKVGTIVYETIYEITKYGSYVNVKEYGMVQEKNAMSYKELVKYGYKSE